MTRWCKPREAASRNIAEGSVASGTSKTELKLVGVAGSLEELLLDYQDFLRQRRLPSGARTTRRHRQSSWPRENRSYGTYRTYIEEVHEVAINT
jgi:hypothetical protein